jgi:general secretion pathway protein H
MVRGTHHASLLQSCENSKWTHKQSGSIPAPSQRGFTLIELLVVLVVMGIALGLVMVQLMPDQRAPLREEAARLALLLENAGLEARASGRSLAWSGEKNNYRFLSKNAYGDWLRIDDDSSFRPRTMPEGVNISEIRVEEQPIRPGDFVLLSAHAFAVPFRIRLSNEYGTASVTGKSTGDVVFALEELPAEKSAR